MMDYMLEKKKDRTPHQWESIPSNLTHGIGEIN